MERTCKKCGETKPIEEFSQHKTFRGTDYICFNCKHKARAKRRRRYEAKNRRSISRQASVYQKRAIKKLGNWYVVDLINQSTGLSRDIIWQNKELIKLYKANIKLKRLIKSKL